MNPTPHHQPWQMASASIISLLAMAYIDYVTGNELIFSAAYLLPVSLCAWYFGRRAVWLMSIASGLTSWLVDVLSGHIYSHLIIEFWNAFICFLVCIITGLLLLRLRRTLAERSRINDDLQRALEELKCSTEQVRRLQDGLQLVCAWTHRIKVGEKWMTPEEFLITQLHLQVSHVMSPEAAHEWGKDLEKPRDEKGPAQGAANEISGGG